MASTDVAGGGGMASGGVASGGVASGGVASGGVASGGVASGGVASGGVAHSPPELHPDSGAQNPPFVLRDVSASHLPMLPTSQACMDAAVADVDADGDLDVVLAVEFGANRLLLNDGTGVFAEQAIPDTRHDSEDVLIADVDGDLRLDLLFVSEDDGTDELFLFRDGEYLDTTGRFPSAPITNGAAHFDVDGDGLPDLLLANQGPNMIWLNQGGRFADVSSVRLAGAEAVTTQDVEVGDVDGDGHLDLVFGNEGPNELWLNDGSGVFSPAAAALPALEDETREVELGDVDGDGDLDLLSANVALFYSTDPTNQLLLNDGAGRFTPAALETLPALPSDTFDADLVDLDGDGDLDVVAASAEFKTPGSGMAFWRNDGRGRFSDESAQVLSASFDDGGFDIEVADFDGDGLLDAYYCARGTARSTRNDHLLLQRR